MEVLSARYTPAFKGEDTFYKRMYETSNKPVKKVETKVEHKSERNASYEVGTTRDVAQRKVFSGSANSWEGSGRKPGFVGARSLQRGNGEGATGSGYARAESIQESASEEVESVEEYETDSSGEEETAAAEPAAEPQQWPLIQVVEPPPWLPQGWTAVLRVRESGSKDKYYVDPTSGRRFRSKTEVNYYLETGKSYRYKRKTKDAVESPPGTSARAGSTDLSNTRDSTGASIPAVGYVEHRTMSIAQMRPDSRVGASQSRGEDGATPGLNRNGYRGGRLGSMIEDVGRPFGVVPKRTGKEERKVAEGAQGPENRGKLILKLKRKTAESDDGRSSVKKPRPFEVVGSPLPVKARMSVGDDLWSNGEPSRLPSSVTGLQSRRSSGKTAPSAWQYQANASSYGQSYGGPSLATVGNGTHGHEKPSASASLSITDSENAKGSMRKESPSEQLQRLGRRLCQQALSVITSDQTLLPPAYVFQFENFNDRYSVHYEPDHNLPHPPATQVKVPVKATAKTSAKAPAKGALKAAPVKRMRGSVSKEKAVVPYQRYAGMEHPFYLQLPQPA